MVTSYLVSKSLHGVLRNSLRSASPLVHLRAFLVLTEEFDCWKALHTLLTRDILVFVGIQSRNFNGGRHS